MAGHEGDNGTEVRDASEETDELREDAAEEAEAGAGWPHGWTSPLTDLQQMMEDLVDGFRELSPTAYVRYPRIEIGSTQEGYLVAMDVPGVKPEDLDLSAEGDELTVHGTRRRPEYAEGTRISRSERAYGRFRRAIRLPGDVDPRGIKARLDAGVLLVTLPRRGRDEGVKIEVE